MLPIDSVSLKNANTEAYIHNTIMKGLGGMIRNKIMISSGKNDREYTQEMMLYGFQICK